MRRKVVWDLFGGGQNSIYNSLDKSKYKVYSIDIVNKFSNVLICDLSNWKQTLKMLNTLPKPEIITASPPCTSFSIILHHNKDERIGWKLQNNKYSPRTYDELKIEHSKAASVLQRMRIERIYQQAVLGDKCLANTIKIIDMFKPKYWYIENPQKSLMWNVIEKNYMKQLCKLNSGQFLNLAYYNNYDETFSLKPTYFLSNVKMSLKHHYIKPSVYVRPKCGEKAMGHDNNETGRNVKIPTELILEIFKEFEKWVMN